MCANDGVANSQTQPDSVFLRAVEWLKNLFFQVSFDSRAIVGDSDPHAFRYGLGRYLNPGRSGPIVLRGLDRVLQQIHKHLLDLNAIDIYRWDAMGSTWVWQGGPGAGQHTKMVNQILIATNMIGVCEALLYGYRAGLDLEQVMQSVASGAAGSWSLSNLGPRIIAGNFDPGFFVEHFIKDMGIALAEAENMRLQLPGLALSKQLYEELASQGHARRGTHALMLALARLSEVKWTVAD